eukprot:jgi/Chrzof1/14673/Cz09g11180.t1
MRASHLFVVVLAAISLAHVRGDGPEDDNNRGNKQLRFKGNKPFKIIQIADIHYTNGASTPCEDIIPVVQEPCSDLNSTAWMAELLAIEKPDLVVFTGDNIWYPGNNDIIAAQRAITKPVQDAKIPYMLTFGNHDTESAPGRAELVMDDMKNPYSLTRFGPQGLHGVVNYAYTIRDDSGAHKVALYVFDGGAYYNVSGLASGYDWIWVRAEIVPTCPASCFAKIQSFCCTSNQDGVATFMSFVVIRC